MYNIGTFNLQVHVLMRSKHSLPLPLIPASILFSLSNLITKKQTKQNEHNRFCTHTLHQHLRCFMSITDVFKQ